MYITHVFFSPYVKSYSNRVYPLYFFKYHLKSVNKFSHQLNLTIQSSIHVFPHCNSHSYLSQLPLLNSHACTIPGTLLMPSRRHYTRALYIYIYSKWVDTVPLSKVRGQFPSLVTPWEGNPNLSPIRKGAVPVSNQKTAGHSLQSVDQWSQSPICRPVQITVDWPINRLSSRDGTYLSVMQWSQHPYQISSTTSTIPSQFSFTSQTHSIPQSQTLILSHTIHFSIPLSKYQIYI